MIRVFWLPEHLPLQTALFENDLKTIQSLITLENVNTPVDRVGRTILHCAIIRSWKVLFKWLMRFPNIRLEYTCPGTGWNALTFALFNNNYVYDLLEAGADLTLVHTDLRGTARQWTDKQRRAIRECRELCIMLLWGYLQFGGAELKPIFQKMAHSLWKTRLNRYWLKLVEGRWRASSN